VTGPVENYLLNKIREDGVIHLTLIDPEKVTPTSGAKIAKDAVASGTAAIMVGGSTLVSTAHLDNVVKSIKKSVNCPVILFPNNITGITRYADAIWFMSLLNSFDPYFLSGVQVLGAPIVKRFGLEPIPMGYIIVGEGGAASVIGRASPIPYDKPELVAAHALAAQYLGMRFVYLEAGSGAKQPIPGVVVHTVRRYVDVTLIVGGGIRSSEQAKAAAKAGADIIVTGNLIEEANPKEKIRSIVESIKMIEEEPQIDSV